MNPRPTRTYPVLQNDLAPKGISEFASHGLTLLTGPNGSGKSRLLRSLLPKDNGAKTKEIQYYDHNVMFSFGEKRPVTNFQIDLLSHTLRHNEFICRVEDLRNEIFGERRVILETIASAAIRLIDHNQVVEEASSKLGISTEDFISQMGAYKQACHQYTSNFRSHTETLIKDISVWMLPNPKNIMFSNWCWHLSQSPMQPAFNLTDKSVNFTDLFARYKSLQIVSGLHGPRFYSEDGSPFILGVEQFEERFGPPPWQEAEEILSDLGLTYKVEVPQQSGFYQFRLLDGIRPVSVGALSSGEKILLALGVLMISKRQIENSLILLDEVDALLNPSLTKSLLRIIERTTNAQDTHLCLVSHSPSTIALWPNENIYLLRRDSSNVTKVTKSESLNTLCADMFSVISENIKIVIVEAEDDEQFYKVAYRVVLHHCGAVPTNLIFIPVERLSNDDGGGKKAVIREVTNLNRNSTSSFFVGMCDRDADENKHSSIVVGQRYCIENYIYDPILVMACVPKERAKSIGIPKIDILNARSVDYAASLQLKIADFCHIMYKELEKEGKLPDNAYSLETVSVETNNGCVLYYPQWLIDVNGKEYRNTLLRYIGGGAVKLDYLLEQYSVMSDWMPKELTDKIMKLSQL